MEIDKIIYSKTPEMVLLHKGKPIEMGGVTKEMDLELANRSLIKVYCVFFNLLPQFESTDFFLFGLNDGKLITYNIGKKTPVFFKERYHSILAINDNQYMDKFIEEFRGDYIVHGMMGNFRLH